MTDSDKPADDTALRESIAALTARLDRIEARLAQPSAFERLQARIAAAWAALRGGGPAPDEAGQSRQDRGLLMPVLTICAVLLALILAVELAEEIFDGLRHLARRIF
jgi:hypothetical protein